MATVTQTQAQALPGLRLTWRQYAGISGIIGTILFAIGVILTGDAPSINDPVADARVWWGDNGQRFLWAQFVIVVGVMFFLVPYIVGLRNRLAEAEGNGGPWAMVAFLSVIFWLLLGGSASIATGALALGIDKLEGDGVVRALQYMDFAGFASNSIVLAPFFLALAFVIMKSKVFWGWLAYLSIALAIASFLGCFAFVSGDPDSPFMLLGLVSTLGFAVTNLLVGFAMLRDAGPAA